MTSLKPATQPRHPGHPSTRLAPGLLSEQKGLQEGTPFERGSKVKAENEWEGQ